MSNIGENYAKVRVKVVSECHPGMTLDPEKKYECHPGMTLVILFCLNFGLKIG